MTTTPSKPDLVALADELRETALRAVAHVGLANYAVREIEANNWIRESANNLTEALHHLASQPSSYEAGLRAWANEAVAILRTVECECDGYHGFTCRMCKAIAALPADGDANDIQSSDGGVEGHAGVQSPSTPTSEALPYDSSTVGAGIKPGPSDTPTSGDAVRTIPHAEVDKIVADLIHANYSDKPRLALAIGRAIVKANRRGIDAALKPEAAAAGEVVCPTCSFTIRKREPVPFKIEDDCATPPAIEGTALSHDQRREEIAREIATKCFDPTVIDVNGKLFWKPSHWRCAELAADAILALDGGDRG